MIIDHRSIRLLLTASALLAIVAGARPARAQDDGEGGAPRPAAVDRVNRAAMDEAQLDRLIFANLGLGNADVARDRLESHLTLRVEDLDRACRLTPAQQKKLLLAGRGDIKHFFDRVEEVKKKYTAEKDVNLQIRFQQIWREIQPMRSIVQSGLFGEGSIYAKAARAMLTPEQAAKYEAVVRDRLLYRYWARVDLTLELLNNEVGFTDDQRQQLLRLLREETRPPRQLGQRDYYVVLYQLSRIPEAKLRAVFEDAQWRFLQRQLEQGRPLETFLKQNGFVPGDEPEAKAGAAAR